MKVLLICLTLNQIQCLIQSVTANCPEYVVIEPCFCEQGAIICKDNSIIDLEDIFRRLSKSYNEREKHFDAFYLDNTLNEELVENTFRDITFDEIHITNCNYLKTINDNAFFGTDRVTKKIILVNNTSLTSKGKSLFTVLSKFINAEHILLKNLDLEEVPSNAFKAIYSYQDKLKSLAFFGTSLKKIGDRSFSSLRRLERLTFWNTSLSWIPEHAFEFEDYSSETLIIWFNSNKLIKGSSFHRNSLANINRPVHIEFACEENNLDYLDAKTFIPFLRKNSQNSIDLGYKEFDSSSCNHHWLFNNPELLNQVKNIKCPDGKYLTDLVEEADRNKLNERRVK